jgi:integrase/recombinase XerD
MKKLKMTSTTMTFEEGCNKYLENCLQRNLRQGTINHYKQSYTQFYKFFDPTMPIEDITQNYINLLVSDIAHQVDEFNVLDKFYGREHIQIKRRNFNDINKGER